MTCLVRITPRLIPGGVLVIDDYDAWSGCRRAVDEYFADKRGAFSFTRKERLHVLRR
jgi:asparagine synthase (glutamine-hydrolysing)